MVIVCGAVMSGQCARLRVYNEARLRWVSIVRGLAIVWGHVQRVASSVKTMGSNPTTLNYGGKLLHPTTNKGCHA